MYFVVYLIEARRHAVIPCYWIYDTKDEMWDKFVNSGLNSSQKYLCYWKSENDSVEYIGAPNEFVEPNFNVPRSTQFPVDEATFYCQIIHFKGEIYAFLSSQNVSIICFFTFLFCVCMQLILPWL